ncbi:hypothetical protein BCF11_5044 [Collimonas sp. PA-H2]|uniref:hypothetical protein n=1 Tax=Collimonas sp. PA-H2 TaxID=1881062 RepID=UPI000BF7083F|nr:hypothetical protein [Collimonas sp. PA-H2]PFH12558.1 hypothetical protein BCF11_5044 [Collimonas sp. PA-H2]
MAELKHIESKSSTRRNEKSGLASGGRGGYDDAMEARVNKLEEFAIDTRERLSRIETRLDACATKSDLKNLEATMHKEFASMHQELHGLTWKLIGAASVLVSIVYFIATQVKP